MDRWSFGVLRARLAIACATGALLLTGCADDLARSRDILFVAQRPGGTEDTYALHLADLTTRRLITADSATSRSLPAWSPDTRSIAFIREFDDHSQLYVLDRVGGTPRELAAQLDGSLAWPDWSPDGAAILFTTELPDHRAAVYAIHPDGSGLRRVLPDTISLRCPSWAPDGHQFAVSAYDAGRSSILAVDVESGAARTLLVSDTTFLDCPQWSPTGEAIVLTIAPGDTAIWNLDPLKAWRSELGILDLKSGQLRLLVGGPGLNNYGHWSRDGRWIVFQSNRHAAPRIDSLPLRDRFRSLEIYIVRPDGSDLKRLTTNEYYDGHPSW
jgi:TolB protein